jgi:hypothetical protein
VSASYSYSGILLENPTQEAVRGLRLAAEGAMRRARCMAASEREETRREGKGVKEFGQALFADCDEWERQALAARPGSDADLGRSRVEVADAEAARPAD